MLIYMTNKSKIRTRLPHIFFPSPELVFSFQIAMFLCLIDFSKFIFLRLWIEFMQEEEA